MEENLYPFVKLVAGVLSDRPLFFLINSYTTGLAPSVLTYILETLLTSVTAAHRQRRTGAAGGGERAASSPAALPADGWQMGK